MCNFCSHKRATDYLAKAFQENERLTLNNEVTKLQNTWTTVEVLFAQVIDLISSIKLQQTKLLFKF